MLRGSAVELDLFGARTIISILSTLWEFRFNIAIYLLKMLFHSYVSLPEGNMYKWEGYIFELLLRISQHLWVMFM